MAEKDMLRAWKQSASATKGDACCFASNTENMPAIPALIPGLVDVYLSCALAFLRMLWGRGVDLRALGKLLEYRSCFISALSEIWSWGLPPGPR